MMKAGERPNSKLGRGVRQESRRFRLLAIVVGFFIVSLTFVVVSKPDAILFGLNGKLPADQAPTSILIQQKVNTPAQKTSTDALGGDPKVVDDEAYVKPKEMRGSEEEDHRVLSEPDPASGMTEPAPNKDGNARKSSVEMLGEERKDEEGERAEKHTRVTLPTVSNYTIHDAEDTENAKQEGLSNDQQHQQGSKPLCDFSNFRANVCEMRGDVRVHPKATSVLFMEPEDSQRDEVWKIKPYPRKGDEFCAIPMAPVLHHVGATRRLRERAHQDAG